MKFIDIDKFVSFVLVLVVTSFMVACSGGSQTPTSPSAGGTYVPPPTATAPGPAASKPVLVDLVLRVPKTEMPVFDSAQAEAIATYSTNGVRHNVDVTKNVEWQISPPDAASVTSDGVITAGGRAGVTFRVSGEFEGRSYGVPDFVTVTSMKIEEVYIVVAPLTEGDLPYTRNGETPALFMKIAYGDIFVNLVNDPRSPVGKSYPFTQFSACAKSKGNILRYTCGVIVLRCEASAVTQACKHNAGSATLWMPVSEALARNQGITAIDGIVFLRSDWFDPIDPSDKYLSENQLRTLNVKKRVDMTANITFHFAQ